MFTPYQAVRSQLALTWGAQTFLTPTMPSTDDMLAEIDDQLLAMEQYNREDMMVVVAGTPPGISGNTNMIHVHLLGEETTAPPEVLAAAEHAKSLEEAEANLQRARAEAEKAEEEK